MNKNIITSGGIVLKDNQILFIYKKGKWDLPKGKIEDGKKRRETAIIETSEETGLPESELKILKKAIPTYYYKEMNGETILKKTYWYVIEFIRSISRSLIPDQHEGITECKWCSIDNLDDVLNDSYERVRYLIDFFLKSPTYERYKQKNKF